MYILVYLILTDIYRPAMHVHPHIHKCMHIPTLHMCMYIEHVCRQATEEMYEPQREEIVFVS